MYGQVIALAVAVLGVDAGWQRRSDDGMDYLIQIQPALVRALEGGQTLESEIPPQLRGKVYAYKITVGTKKLSQDPPLEELGKTSPVPNSPSLFGPATGAPPGPPLPQATSPNSGSAFGGGQWPGAFAAKPPVDPPVASATASSGAVSASGVSNTTSAAAADSGSSTRLWTYLIVALVALAGSVSWNVYLLWLLREARKRYRNLLQRSGLTQEELEEEEDEEEEEEEEEE